MTHLNTNHQLPVRTGTSPMEDAIVLQVEWYMGRVNLEKDEFLKQKMDEDLWVSLDVILNFPKMIRMGVTDKRRVATLLNARSTVVEVDEKTARIRPAWARRSNLVIHNVPVGTRRDQVAALFHIPSPTADPNSTIPPPASHPAGLVTIQPLSDTVWVAMFDSPSGAEAALPLVIHKSVNGQEITAETHVENVLPPARSDLEPMHNQTSVYQPSNNVHHDPSNTNHPSYPQMSSMMSAPMINGQMMTPVPMPMPVMHPNPELHHQYTYTHAAATYMAPQGYAPPGVPVPGPYIGAHRGVPHGYVMGYHHQPMSYEQQAHIAQSHPMPIGHAPGRGNPPMMPGRSAPEDAANVQMPNGFQSASGTPNGTLNAQSSQNGGANGNSFTHDQSGSQIHADGIAMQQTAQAYSAGMQIPSIPVQAIENSLVPLSIRDQDVRGTPRAALEGHFGAMIVDSSRPAYIRNRGPMSANNRDRTHQKNFHEGGSRQGMKSMANGEGRPGPHRKGKKGNRNSVRHGGHGQHERQNDGRLRESRGEGSGSDTGNREERRISREEKPRPEPNFASMNFPPLPGGENLQTRPPSSNKKLPELDPNPAEAATVNAVSSAGPASATPKAVKTPSATLGSPISSDRPLGTPEFKKGSDGLQNNAGQPDVDVGGAPRSLSDTTLDSSRVVKATAPEKKPVEIKNQLQTSPSTMSYAAILRSKKPAACPLSVSTRSNSEGAISSGANDVELSNVASYSNGSLKDKDKKKKGNGQRSANPADGLEKRSGSSGSASALVRVNSKSSTGSGSGHSLQLEGATKEGGTKVKSAMESSRAHSVWANKPKSLFQAAPVPSAVRPATPQQAFKSQKVTSPVSSHEEEKEQSGEAGKAQILSSAIEKIEAEEEANKNKLRTSLNQPRLSADSKALCDEEKGSHQPDDNPATPGLKEKSATGDQGSHAPVKGAWAIGGPRPWPKTRNHAKVAKNTTVSEY